MKRDLLYVEHILECIRRIEEYLADGRDSFRSSTLIQDAVIRNLQLLAESAKRISPEGQFWFRTFLGGSYLDSAISSFTNILALTSS